MGRRIWYLKRAWQGIVTLFAVITLTFALIRVIPSGPAEKLRAQLIQQYEGQLSVREINRIVEAKINYDPSKPLWLQYRDYMLRTLSGDLGESINNGRPVVEIIAEGVPWTVFIALNATLIGFFFGVSLGAVMAFYEGGKLDSFLTIQAIVMSSIPYYVTAILGVIFLSIQLGWFPQGGRTPAYIEPSLRPEFVLGVLHHATLPLLSLLLGGALASLSMRGNAIRVLGEDYLRVARLRGLSDSRITRRYVLHNAILPSYTGLILSFGFMFGGSIILEQIFSYRGMGLILLEAVTARDYPLMMGTFMLITIAVVIAAYVADISYGLIDPRIDVTNESQSGTTNRRLAKWIQQVKQYVLGTADQSPSDDSEVLIEDGSTGDFFETKSVETRSRTVLLADAIDRYLVIPARIIWEDRRTQVGVLIVVLYALMGTIGVIVVPVPRIAEGPTLLPPFQNMQYPLGTDGRGQDLLGLTVHATPQILKMIIAGALFSTIVGTIVGTLAGYVGGTADRVLSTITDTMMTIPGLPLVIILSSFITDPNPYFIGIILSIGSWAGLARSLRSQILSSKEESYIEASEALGLSTTNIMFVDLIPPVMPYILVHAVQRARGVIFGAVGLYFLGLLPFDKPNWGVVLQSAYSKGFALVSLDAIHWFLVPMIAIIGLSLGLILIAQGMDRLFNPRIRAKHADSSEETDTEETGDTPFVHP